MKRAIDYYMGPTPLKWRRIGNAIFHLGTLITGCSVLMEHDHWAIGSLFLMWIGKTITDLFKIPDAEGI